MEEIQRIKINVFGWPVFNGKAISVEWAKKVYSIDFCGKFWITFKNDLSAINITKKYIKKPVGFITEVEVNHEVGVEIMNMAAVACKVSPNQITSEQITRFMLYITEGIYHEHGIDLSELMKNNKDTGKTWESEKVETYIPLQELRKYLQTVVDEIDVIPILDK